MKALACLIALLAAVPPLGRAEDWSVLFGMTGGDVAAAIAKAQADMAARRAERAAGPGGWERLTGAYAVPAQRDLRCIFQAVGRRLGASVKLEDAPPVYLNSRTLLEDFAEHVIAQNPS